MDGPDRRAFTGAEAKLNALPQFMTTTNGWPGSVFERIKLIGPPWVGEPFTRMLSGKAGIRVVRTDVKASRRCDDPIPGNGRHGARGAVGRDSSHRAQPASAIAADPLPFRGVATDPDDVPCSMWK